MINAKIFVTRDNESVEITLAGKLERFGSYNPHESGLRVAECWVVEPRDFQLTALEYDRALEELERAI